MIDTYSKIIIMAKTKDYKNTAYEIRGRGSVSPWYNTYSKKKPSRHCVNWEIA